MKAFLVTNKYIHIFVGSSNRSLRPTTNSMKKLKHKLPVRYRCLLIISGLLLSFTLGAQIRGNQMVVKNKSSFNFEETVSRIETNLKVKEIPVFAVFDHSRNAEDVGLKLNPNKVIVLGSPKVGTLLMQENPAISIELPLKISVWQDDRGEVWVAFLNMEKVAGAYGMADSPIVKSMHLLLGKIVNESISG